MRVKRRKRLAVSVAAAGLMLLGVPGVAMASSSGTFTCTGTLTSPGELAGTYSNVVIDGGCAVDAGPVVVTGNLTVAPNGILNADFGANNSNITIDGNLVVQQNASVLMGCDTIFVTIWVNTFPPPLSVPSFPCFDDPNPNAPTLASHDVVKGNVIGNQPLGIVLNGDSVDGNFIENGGGGGPSCVPSGVFKQDVGFPPYSLIADGNVNGNVQVSGLSTCFLGMFRVLVGGNMNLRDVTASDPDSTEVVTNTIHGNFTCQNLTPAPQWGDSDGFPNKVGGNATGQCAFGITAPNPPPEAGVVGVVPVQQPISVPLN